MENNNKTKSIMTVRILDTNYKVRRKNKKVTICKIRWVNPANGNIQCSYGATVCNSEDEFNQIVGQGIAESRAKIQMYRDYLDNLKHTYFKADRKIRNLKCNEIVHLDAITPSRQD